MPLTQHLPRSAWQLLLDQVLEGLRHGGVPPWPSDRWPRLKRRLEQQYLGPIWGTLGDKVPEQERWPWTVQLLLQWACGLIRPDHQNSLGLAQIPETAWVEQTVWRPLLAVAATSGLLPIPALPRHYRRNAGEGALDTLCGLWAVGSSTTYRYIEKGRRMLVDALFSAQTNARQRWALRDLANINRGQIMPAEWHIRQAEMLSQHGHAMDAAWHLFHIQQWKRLGELLERRALELASDIEHIELCQLLRRTHINPLDKISLILGESIIWRCVGDNFTELYCLNLALRTSESMPEPEQSLCCGKALCKLGFYYNSRDPEQAICHLEAARERLLVASKRLGDQYQNSIQNYYIFTTSLMAFIHMRRNNQQGQLLLRSAVASAQECNALNTDAQGMLLKVLSEEARCQDQLESALRYRQQALVLFERVADLKEIAECYSNLGLLLAQMGRADDAKNYCERVIEMSRKFCIRPEGVLSAYGGLALAAMTLKDLDSAANHLDRTLEICRKFDLRRHEVTTLENLAEVHYLRFIERGNSDDESLGDFYAEQGRCLAESLGLSTTKLRELKKATLNPGTATHHLLPIETSAHPSEFAKIEALRAELALPRPPAQRARTHIALSQLYLRIAAKERDAARGLMQTHGLSELEADIEALQQTWAHDGNLASQLSSRWRELVGDWLTDSQRKAVLERLLAEGSLSKSSYGEAAGVSPATASKHLGLLADKGLLEQQGRGPATRYVLPSGQNSGSRDGAAAAGSPGSVH